MINGLSRQNEKSTGADEVDWLDEKNVEDKGRHYPLCRKVKLGQFSQLLYFNHNLSLYSLTQTHIQH